MRPMIFFLLLLVFARTYAQDKRVTPAARIHAPKDSPLVQNLYFFKKEWSGIMKTREDSATRALHSGSLPGAKYLYIYRNCVYLFELKNKQLLEVKVEDIRNDSLIVTVLHKDRVEWMSLSPSQLKGLRVRTNLLLGGASVYSLENRTYFFETSGSREFERKTDSVYLVDSGRVVVCEMAMVLHDNFVARAYPYNGAWHEYTGIKRPDGSDTMQKPPVRIIGFAPFWKPEIHGVNIGLQSMIGERPAAVKGLNVSADPATALLTFLGLFTLFYNNNAEVEWDTVDRKDFRGGMTGLSISGGGMGGSWIKGVAINGGLCYAKESDGLTITGVQNIIETFRGVEIVGLRNSSLKGRGVQIGLINLCKDLKGIQIGLWNANGKRKLPFINWGW